MRTAGDKSRTGRRVVSLGVPAECDVSIRPGWFYHAKEDARVKTGRELVDLYYSSVGRGASFLLNLAPDRRGQIPEPDVRSLREFRRLQEATFSDDLARDARVSASNVRGHGDRRFSPSNVIDQRRDTYWASDDDIKTPELILNLRREVTFNVVRLREFLPLGQRVEAFAIDTWQHERWQEFATGTSIGNSRLIRGPFITTAKVRLRIVKAPVCPAIAELGLFAEQR
jgi:alpha-L-fucosidase